jgi:hypothetical protein
VVFDPGGDSVYGEVIAGVTGRIRSRTNGTEVTYRFCAQIADIDGAGQAGQYCAEIIAVADQGARWTRTQRNYCFQVMGSTNRFSTFTDSLLAAMADANTLLKNRMLRMRDTLDAVLDTLQNINSALRVDTNTIWTTVTRDSVLANLVDTNAKMKARIAYLDSIQAGMADSHISAKVWSAAVRSITAIANDAITAAAMAANCITSDEIAASADAELANYFWERLYAQYTSDTTMAYRLLNSGSSVWSTAQRDSLLNVVADANTKLKVRIAYLDSLNLYDTRFDSILAVIADNNTRMKVRIAYLDSLNLYDTRFDSLLAFIADGNSKVKVKLGYLDSLNLYDTRWDSVLANFADANPKWATLTDIVTLLDTSTAYLHAIAIASDSGGASNWTNAQRDSVLAALADNNAKLKAKIAKLDSLDLYDVRFDSLLAASTNASFLAKVWNIAFNTGFTTGSLGDSINNATYVQGAAGADTWNTTQRDSVLAALADANTKMKVRIAYLDSLNLYDTRFDSLLAAASTASYISKIWNVAFTYGFTAGSLGDSLSTPAYVQGSGGADTWSTVQRDSVLNALTDANLLLKNRLLRIRDSVDIILDSLQLQDNWVAKQSDMQKVLDSLGKVIDSLENYDNWIAKEATLQTVKDSVNAILDSVQYYLDAQISSISISGGSNWSNAQRDSVLEAIKDASIKMKVWLNATYRVVDSNRTGSTGAGSGDYSVTFNAKDTLGTDTVLYNAKLSVNNLAQTGIPWVLFTDINGNAVFQLDAGTYVIIIKKAGYASIIDTVIITGAGVQYIYTYNSSVGLTVLYGQVNNSQGIGVPSAIVQLELKSNYDSLLTVGDTVISRRFISDTADNQGYFAVAVYSNDIMNDTTSYYQIKFLDRTGRIFIDDRIRKIRIPDTTSTINYLSCERIK